MVQMDNIQNKNELVISRKMVSVTLAVCILMNAFFFIAGFFWGYRHATADVQIGLNKVSFTDQINYTASQQFDNNGMAVDQINPDAENVITTPVVDELKSEAASEVTEVIVTEKEEPATQKYYAELIGFGHLKTAQAFVDKMQKKGYPIVIRKRMGKNGNDKNVNWYQAITENFEDRAKLIKLIEVIKKTEHLRDIKIKKV